MQNAAKLLWKVIKTCGNKQLFSYLKISSNWEYVVGNDLFSSSSLHSINKDILIINVISSAAIFIKNKENTILDRVNSMANNDHLFTKIVIKHCIKIEKTNEAA